MTNIGFHPAKRPFIQALRIFLRTTSTVVSASLELFEELKGCEGVTPQMYESLKKLFERADYVKFAKYVADDEENAQALPLSVNFVTSTYQAQIEEEGKNVL